MQRVQKEIDGTVDERSVTADILDKILPNIEWTKERENTKIVDLGCGSGVITKLILAFKLSGKFERVLGVDNRNDYYNYATDHYSDTEDVTFHIGDGEMAPLPVHKNQFYLVTSFHYLQKINDPTTALGKMLQYVQPGGHFIITFEYRNEYDDFIFEALQSSKWAEYINDIEPPLHLQKDITDKFISVIEDAGFEIIYKELRECEFRKNRKEYMDYLKSVDQYHKEMRRSDRKEFFRYVKEKYVKKHLCPDNPSVFILKYTTMAIHAKHQCQTKTTTNDSDSD